MSKINIIILSASLMALWAFSIDTILPSISYLKKDFDFLPQNSHWIITSVFIGIAIGQLVFGPVSDSIGRKKTAKNAPRKCDIDILDYSSKKMSKGVILPHPRMHTRNFVLFPLFEINKNWKQPISKKSIKTLICSLSNKEIRSIKKIWFNGIMNNAKFWRLNK